MARAADFPSALITESFSTPALRICPLGHRSFGPIILAALENLSSHPGRAAAKGRRVVSLSVNWYRCLFRISRFYGQPSQC